MYCPFCGARNDAGAKACFVCLKPLPSLEPGRQAAPAAAPATHSRPTRTSASAVVWGSVGDRGIALIMDRLLLAALSLFALGWIAGSPDFNAAKLPSPVWTGVLLTLGFFLLTFLYHTILEATLGTTIGKAVMELQVSRGQERSRLGAIAIRNALRLVDGLGLYLVGFLVALFSPHKERIGDFVAGTMVLSHSSARVGRAILLAAWLAVVLGCLWLAANLCPECDAPLRRIRITY